MKRMSLVVALLISISMPGAAVAAGPDWKAVEQALGKPGQMQPGFALGSYAAFKQMGDHVMVMGDLVLLDQEIPAVLSGLFAGGLEVTAVHNHLNEVSPHTMYMHYSGHGDAVRMARVFQVTVPRAETITEMGQTLLPGIGIVTVMNFQPTSAGKAALRQHGTSGRTTTR